MKIIRSMKFKITPSSILAFLSMSLYLLLNTTVFLGLTPSDYESSILSMLCMLLYVPTSTYYIFELNIENKREKEHVQEQMDAISLSCVIAIFDKYGFLEEANDNFHTLIPIRKLVGRHYSEIFEHNIKWGMSLVSHTQIAFNKIFNQDIWLDSTLSPIKGSEGLEDRILLIATDQTSEHQHQQEILRKNAYLEHSAKIIRHDLHSGICTYIPRGIRMLEQRFERMDPELYQTLRLETAMKMLRGGLEKTQNVYHGVRNFTDLVRKDQHIQKTKVCLKGVLKNYLSKTTYADQVLLDPNLECITANKYLFCIAIDNLIQNGLKYNDSPTKQVRIYMKDGDLAITDNGRGMTQKEFEIFALPYRRKPQQKESGTGLGLNICVAILKEHNFTIKVDNQDTEGTTLLVGGL